MSGDDTLSVLYEPMPPMVSLMMAPSRRMRDAIHRGVKTATIRQGLRDYQSGQRLVLACPILPWAVSTTIKTVSHCKASQVTVSEYKSAGFNTREEMVAGEKRHYPDFCLDTKVTVVTWGQLFGYWAEHPDEYLLYHDEMRKKIPRI